MKHRLGVISLLDVFPFVFTSIFHIFFEFIVIVIFVLSIISAVHLSDTIEQFGQKRSQLGYALSRKYTKGGLLVGVEVLTFNASLRGRTKMMNKYILKEGLGRMLEVQAVGRQEHQ